MAELSTKEVADVFVQFINDAGLWFKFKDWVEQQGYSLDELSVEDDE